jgi:hypothetical protein
MLFTKFLDGGIQLGQSFLEYDQPALHGIDDRILWGWDRWHGRERNVGRDYVMISRRFIHGMSAMTNIPTRGDCVEMLWGRWERDGRAAFDVGRPRDAVGDSVRVFERTLDEGDGRATFDVERDAVGDPVRVFERTLELA